MAEKSQGVIRLGKEFRVLAKDFEKQIQKHGKITDNFVCSPDEHNIFIWYFVIFGLTDCPYEGGFYMGKIIFPLEYPWKPPEIRMLTETGRFEINTPICLSISNFHPESWNPVWPVRSIILGLISFFLEDTITAGYVVTTLQKKKDIAAKSKETIVKKKQFNELFAGKREAIGFDKSDKDEQAEQAPNNEAPKVQEEAIQAHVAEVKPRVDEIQPPAVEEKPPQVDVQPPIEEQKVKPEIKIQKTEEIKPEPIKETGGSNIYWSIAALGIIAAGAVIYLNQSNKK